MCVAREHAGHQPSTSTLMQPLHLHNRNAQRTPANQPLQTARDDCDSASSRFAKAAEISSHARRIAQIPKVSDLAHTNPYRLGARGLSLWIHLSYRNGQRHRTHIHKAYFALCLVYDSVCPRDGCGSVEAATAASMSTEARLAAG